MWDTMNITFRANHINDSIFIEDLASWHQWLQNDVILHIKVKDKLFVSELLLDNRYTVLYHHFFVYIMCKYQRENLQIRDKFYYLPPHDVKYCIHKFFASLITSGKILNLVLRNHDKQKCWVIKNRRIGCNLFSINYNFKRSQ